MAYLLPSRFLALLGLGTVLLFNGCCANDVCNCTEELSDGFELRFASSFSNEDLDTVMVLRYPLITTPRTIPETVTLVRTGDQRRDAIVLNNTTPFAQIGTTKLDHYHYEVKYYTQQRGSKPLVTNALTIDSVRIKGSLEGNGCCTCYFNTEKIVFARSSRNTLANQAQAFLEITK